VTGESHVAAANMLVDMNNMVKSETSFSMDSAATVSSISDVKSEEAENDQLFKKVKQIRELITTNEYNQAGSSKCEDLDDEFVVVPACLDLSRKWKPSMKKPSTVELTGNDEEIGEELESCNSSFYMEKIDEDDRQSTASSKYIVSSTKDEKETAADLNCSFSTINQDDEDNESRLRASNETLNEIPTEEPSAETKQAADTSVLSISETDAKIAQPSMANTDDLPVEPKSPKSNDYLSTLKNALSNMAGPTYVSLYFEMKLGYLLFYLLFSFYSILFCSNNEKKVGNVSLGFSESNQINSSTTATNDTQSEQSVSTSISEHTIAHKEREILKSIQENLKKLLNMGFANRQLNEKLLKEHNNDLEHVIGVLLEKHDNNWAERRH
jgi:hypothetical protein